ncbi:MAG: helix-turn-helix domain-containing protein [Bacillota bacterium]
MNCYVCNGEMKRVKKDVEVWWGDRAVVFRGMEPWVCEKCGAEAYEPDDARIMHGLVRAATDLGEYPEIMNVEEVADLLRVSTQTVYNLTRKGELPATKVGREWRFSREKIMKKLASEFSTEISPAIEPIPIVAPATRTVRGTAAAPVAYTARRSKNGKISKNHQARLGKQKAVKSQVAALAHPK